MRDITVRISLEKYAGLRNIACCTGSCLIPPEMLCSDYTYYKSVGEVAVSAGDLFLCTAHQWHSHSRLIKLLNPFKLTRCFLCPLHLRTTFCRFRTILTAIISVNIINWLIFIIDYVTYRHP
jgi:hypothetical protein